MNRKELVEFIANKINKVCEAELGQVHAWKTDGKCMKTTDTKIIAEEVVDALCDENAIISKYEYEFLQSNQKDGRPDGATNLLIKMNTQDTLKEFVEWLKTKYENESKAWLAIAEEKEQAEDEWEKSKANGYFGRSEGFARCEDDLDQDLEQFLFEKSVIHANKNIEKSTK